jgi:hypothetical protein
MSKNEMKRIVLQLLSGETPNPTLYQLTQYAHLRTAVAYFATGQRGHEDPRLEETDRETFDELWLDLIIDKVITVRIDQPEFFRVHSEAKIRSRNAP